VCASWTSQPWPVYWSADFSRRVGLSKLAFPEKHINLSLVKQVSVINIEETIGKTVGRRKPPNHLCPKTHSIERSKGWYKAFPIGSPPRGIQRFQTHEEANQWILKNTVVKIN